MKSANSWHTPRLLLCLKPSETWKSSKFQKADYYCNCGTEDCNLSINLNANTQADSKVLFILILRLSSNISINANGQVFCIFIALFSVDAKIKIDIRDLWVPLRFITGAAIAATAKDVVNTIKDRRILSRAPKCNVKI